jgi:hypothetical protein
MMDPDELSDEGDDATARPSARGHATGILHPCSDCYAFSAEGDDATAHPSARVHATGCYNGVAVLLQCWSSVFAVLSKFCLTRVMMLQHVPLPVVTLQVHIA